MATPAPATYQPQAQSGKNSWLRISPTLLGILLSVFSFGLGVAYKGGESTTAIQVNAAAVNSKVSSDKFEEFEKRVDTQFQDLKNQISDLSRKMDDRRGR